MPLPLRTGHKYLVGTKRLIVMIILGIIINIIIILEANSLLIEFGRSHCNKSGTFVTFTLISPDRLWLVYKADIVLFHSIYPKNKIVFNVLPW